VRRVFFTLFDSVHQLLQSPIKVLWICLALAFINLILDGSLYRYYILNKDLNETREKIHIVSKSNADLNSQITKMKDPSHLEQVARERFDLVKENELVFVFSEDQTP
jgi:cell division protein FtsB